MRRQLNVKCRFRQAPKRVRHDCLSAGRRSTPPDSAASAMIPESVARVRTWGASGFNSSAGARLAPAAPLSTIARSYHASHDDGSRRTAARSATRAASGFRCAVCSPTSRHGSAEPPRRVRWKLASMPPSIARYRQHPEQRLGADSRRGPNGEAGNNSAGSGDRNSCASRRGSGRRPTRHDQERGATRESR